MRYSTTAIVLAAMSIGEAVAGPTHAHLHRKAHEKKDVDWSTLDWNNMGIDWAAAYSSGIAKEAAATAAPAATAASVAAAVSVAAVEPTAAAAVAVASPASTPSVIDDVTTAVESGIESLFDGVVGASNSRTTFGASDDKNTGSVVSYIGQTGNPYGSNIIKVASASGHQFTANFINTQSDSITVNVWNKPGSDGQANSGSALAPHDTSLTFALAPGASQVVAFMENSQVGWAQACSGTTESGAFDTTWGEANFLAAGSGYDMSAIMNSLGNVYNMAISSDEAPACISDPTQNYWLTPTQPIGNSDGSCYIAQSTATLTVKMGGSS